MKRKRSPRMTQTSIPGTEAVTIPEIENAIFVWLEAADDAKRAAAHKKEAAALLVAQMLEHKVDVYPYLDPNSGKKRRAVATPQTKIKTANAPRGEGRKLDADYDRPEIEAEIGDKNADKVESRRVSRESVAEEIGEADGFKELRARMALVPPDSETEH